MAKYQILELFYNSKEWKQFRIAYIEQRVHEDSGSFCDYCGKHIDLKEDIQLHHEIEITPTNVGDANIALNPDNIKQLHRACHNTIHKHALSKNKRVFLVYGPPGADIENYIAKRAWAGDLIADMDMIYEALSGLPRYTKPDNLLYNVKGVYNQLIDNIKTRYGKWDNAWIVGGYPDRYQRDKVAEQTGAEVVHIQATREQCIANIKQDPRRAKQEQEWTRYIDNWFDRHTD